MAHGTQNTVASSSPSSQISHLISFGFTTFAEELEEIEEVAAGTDSTEATNRLAGSEEAEMVAGKVAAAFLPFPAFPQPFPESTAGAGAGTVGMVAVEVGISKTARHTGHLKGGVLPRFIHEIE